MTTSRAGSASAGEASNVQHKANRASQHNDSRINGSNRVFGLDGASDDYGSAAHHPGHSSRHPLTPSDRKYRALSRKPSPYRHKPNRSLSRSRSPYRKDRSPSPFRHGGRGGYDSRPYKRKASPPYHRPEKRHLTERNRPEPRHKPFSDDVRAAQHQPGSLKEHKDVTERPYVKPISYAELEHPSAVPNFQSGLPTNGQAQKSRSYDHERGRTGYEMSRQSKPSTIGVQAQVVPPAQAKDVEMSVASTPPSSTLAENYDRKNTSGESDDIAAPVEEIVPTEESREEKRRRWAAKRAALSEQQKNDSLLHQAILTNASVVTTPTGASPMRYADHSMSPFGSPQTGNFDSASASPDVMFDKQEGVSGGNSPAAESPSAANYDPVQDMLDDRDRAARKNHNSELSSGAYRETDPNLLSTLPAEKARPVRKQTKELDMFASDEEDEEAEVVLEHDVEARGTVLDEKLLDNWDDPDGYYKLISNELVNNGRYRMVRHLGRGVFANVAQAVDVEAQTDDPSRQLVAIKMIRRNELMRKASQKEMDFLYKANDADPQDKRHIIRLLGSFDHKGHLCIVFEHMSKNLRDLLKEETNGHGLTLSAVRIYAKQMLHGLQHLQGCQIIHLDIKPDNILVSADKKTIKLADFGTAVDKRERCRFGIWDLITEHSVVYIRNPY